MQNWAGRNRPARWIVDQRPFNLQEMVDSPEVSCQRRLHPAPKLCCCAAADARNRDACGLEAEYILEKMIKEGLVESPLGGRGQFVVGNEAAHRLHVANKACSHSVQHPVHLCNHGAA